MCCANVQLNFGWGRVQPQQHDKKAFVQLFAQSLEHLKNVVVISCLSCAIHPVFESDFATHKQFNKKE